jgi:phage terminase large subunit
MRARMRKTRAQSERIRVVEEIEHAEDAVPERTQDQIWLEHAREFAVVIDNEPFKITRYDNHGQLIAEGKWVAVRHYGGLNPHYVSYNADRKRWVLTYKMYHGFTTYQQAYTAAVRAVETMKAGAPV